MDNCIIKISDLDKELSEKYTVDNFYENIYKMQNHIDITEIKESKNGINIEYVIRSAVENNVLYIEGITNDGEHIIIAFNNDKTLDCLESLIGQEQISYE